MESAETPRLVSVMDGNACAGFLINLGPRGVEAFDKDEKSLGVFPDAPRAATAVKRAVVPALPPPVEDGGMNAPLEPAHSPFGGSVAARILRCPASVGLVAEGAGASAQIFEPTPSAARRSTRQWRF